MKQRLMKIFILVLALGMIGSCSTSRQDRRSAEGPTDRGGVSTSPTAPDAALTSKVKAKLLSDDMLSAMKIDVDSEDGVVYLSGVVDSADQKRKAVELAQNTEGVRRVEDNLKVGQFEGSSIKKKVPNRAISVEDIG